MNIYFAKYFSGFAGLNRYAYFNIACIIFAILFGYAVIIFNPIILIGGLVIILLAPLSIAFPNILGWAVLVLSFGLVPFVPIDFRVFSELVVYSGIMLVAIKYLVGERDFAKIIVPLKWPLLAFLVAWLIALFIGYIQKRYVFAGADARRYMGLLAIPLFALIEFRKTGTVQRLVIWTALWAAIMLVVQFGTGLRVFGGVKGFMEGGVGKGFEDVARGSAEGGNYLVVFALYYCFLSYALNFMRHRKLWFVLGMVLCFFAIVAIFSRGLWAGVLLGGVSILIFARGYRIKIAMAAGQGFVLLSLLLIALYPVATKHFDSAYERVFSIEVEGGRGTSLGARFDENSQALTAIKGNYLFGLGHGGEYKRFTPQVQRGFVNEATFIHNSYLWVALKLGLIGVLAVAGLIFVYMKLAIKGLSPDVAMNHNINSLSAIGVLVVFMVNGLTSPVWAQFSDLVSFSIILVMLSSGSIKGLFAGK